MEMWSNLRLANRRGMAWYLIQGYGDVSHVISENRLCLGTQVTGRRFARDDTPLPLVVSTYDPNFRIGGILGAVLTPPPSLQVPLSEGMFGYMIAQLGISTYICDGRNILEL